MKYQLERSSVEAKGVFGSIYPVKSDNTLLAKIIMEHPPSGVCRITPERQAYCVYRELYTHYIMGSLENWCYDSNKNRYCLIIRKAPGEMVSSYCKDTDSYQKLKEIQECAYKSLEDFHGKTGFFHNDPHGGNIIYDPTTQKAQLIDYGYTRFAGAFQQLLEKRVTFPMFAFMHLNNQRHKLDLLKEILNKPRGYDYWFTALLLGFCALVIAKETFLNILGSFYIVNSLISLVSDALYQLISMGYKQLDFHMPGNSLLKAVIVVGSLLCFGLTGLGIYSLSSMLLNSIVLKSLIDLSTSKLAFLIYPAFAVAVTRAAYNIIQMLKICYGLAEELIDSFLVPKEFVLKKAEFFAGKRLDPSEIQMPDDAAASTARLEQHLGENPEVISTFNYRFG